MKGTIDLEGTCLLTVLYVHAKRPMHVNGQRWLSLPHDTINRNTCDISDNF